jgi:hypothetical protein
MLKNILKLNGAQQLSKNEQKEVNGGIIQKDRFCIYIGAFEMQQYGCPTGHRPQGNAECCPN